MVDFPTDSSPSTKRIDRYYYSMGDRLGQGAFGTVYLGHDIDDKNKLFAIKVIPVSIIKTDPALQESLMNEMQVMKLLNHPNITRCFDVLSSPNNHYFIMEYCSGGTLTSYLKKRGKIPEPEALTILIQILKGYHEMLKLGIIHRDLKPDNILVHEGVFKLADFGFARCVENFSKDLLKSLVGTPLYMSPQILQQQEYSTKSDLWSISLIYYEMLFGKTPWDAKTQYELVNKILHQPPKFPPDIRISEESKSFILGALQVEENARLSWDQVFSHPVFNDCFDYRRRRTTLQEKAINYQGMLKSRIIEKNIDLFKLFAIIDKNNNNQLEMNEFAELMKKLDDKISREQIEFIYNSIDENGDNSISLLEFRTWLSTENQFQKQPTVKPNPANNIQRNQSLPFQPTPPVNQNYQGSPSSFSNNQNNSMNTTNTSPNHSTLPPHQMPNPTNNQIPNQMYMHNQMQGSQGFSQGNQGYIPPPQNQIPPFNPNPMPPPYNSPTGFQMGGGGFNPYGSGNFMQPQPFGMHPGPEMYNNSQPPFNQSKFNPTAFQNQAGLNYIPMQMQGPSPQMQSQTGQFVNQIRFYLQKTQSNVEKLYNFARGNQPDIDRTQFGWFISMINLPMMLNEDDLNMIFWEFDLDRDGKIGFLEFKKLILNT